MSDDPPKKPHRPATWYRYMDASSLGIEIAISVVLGAGVGMWLEKNVTHWSPWTSVIGMMLGVATAGRALFRTARSYTKQLQDLAVLEATEAQEAAANEPPAAKTEHETSAGQ